MKKLIAAAAIGTILFAYGITHQEPETLFLDPIIVTPEQYNPIIVLEVYHDDTNSTMSPGYFRAVFDRVTNAWEDCGVVFELSDNKNARIHINWKPELETGEEAYAEADYCGGNLEQSEVTLSIPKFKRLTSKAKSDTIAHELGHILCIDHSDNERSLMYDTMFGTTQKTMPSDVKQCIDNLPNLYKEEN